MTIDEILTRVARDPDPIAVDLETTGPRVEQHFPVGAAVAFGDGQAVYLAEKHEGGGNGVAGTLDVLAQALNRRSGAVVAHNALFDLGMLSHWHGLTRPRWACTQTRAALINEHRHLNLAAVAKACGAATQKDDALYQHLAGLFGGPATRKAQITNLCRAPGDDPVVVHYAVSDALACLDVYHRQVKDMEAQDLHEVEALEDAVREQVVWLHRRGFRVNTDRMEQVLGELEDWADRETAALGGLNTKSGPQVQNWLSEHGVDLSTLPLTEGGAPATDKEALSGIPIAEPILRTRAVRTAIGYLKSWMKLVHNGRLHTSLHMTPTEFGGGATTGRMSSSAPNFQNIAKRGGGEAAKMLRSCFVADEGMDLWECDYSQIEPRLAVAYSGDEGLIADYSNRETDFYARQAEAVGITRQSAKGLILAMLYGGGVPAIARFTGVSEQEARALRTRFEQTFPALVALSKTAQGTHAKYGCIRNLDGRVLHARQFFNTRLNRRDWDHFRALNKLIQGSAAGVMKQALVNVGTRVHTADVIAPIHDSLVFEVEAGDTETPQAVRAAMEAVGPEWNVPVPLFAELAGPGKSFDELG